MPTVNRLARHTLIAAAIASLLSVEHANAYVITDSTANQNGVSFNADASHTGFNQAGAITATFTYNGPLTFNDTAPQNTTSAGDLNANFFNAAAISNYHGSGSLAAPANANFSTLSNFLASSGSAANYLYGSFFTIDLGVLAAGTLLTITHDDGASVYQNGHQIGNTTVGPTTAVTETVKLTSTADTILYYARENGTPSVLDVSIPEPASMAILGIGAAGALVARRRRRKAANNAGQN